MRSTSAPFVAPLSALALHLSIGCAHEVVVEPESAALAPVELAVAIPAESRVEELVYTITGAALPSHLGGVVPVTGQPSTLQLLAGELPVREEYEVAVDGRTQDGSRCHGAADFTVNGPALTTVDVQLRCASVDEFTQDFTEPELDPSPCPIITDLSAAPPDTGLPGPLTLRATLSPADPLAEVRWSSDAGVLSASSGLTTELTCRRSGTFLVTASLDRPGCRERSWSFPVECATAPTAP
jgi:hypothetical protein